SVSAHRRLHGGAYVSCEGVAREGDHGCYSGTRGSGPQEHRARARRRHEPLFTSPPLPSCENTDFLESGPIWVRHAFLLVEMNDPLNAHPSDPESFEPMNRHGEDPSRPGSPSDNRVRFREALLLEQIRAGDAGAARHFVGDHYPRIYRYLLYLTGRREMAEDLTQETFLQAWRYLDRFVP